LGGFKIRWLMEGKVQGPPKNGGLGRGAYEGCRIFQGFGIARQGI